MKGYIVIGPESTGTRMTTRFLLAKGCLGDDTHQQKWDKEPFLKSIQNPIVWRKSVPHGPEWPDVIKMKKKFNDYGINDIRVVITTRDWWPQVSSMWQNHVKPNMLGAKFEDTISRNQRAFIHIFKGLDETGLPFIVTNYESLTSSIDSLNSMMKFLELPIFTKKEWDNLALGGPANAKWYNNGD